MRKFLLAVLTLLCVSAVIVAAAEKEKTHLRARLFAIEENPTNITNGTGTFTATVNDDSTITYTLSYKNLSAPAVVAHIHIGATKTNGGVSIFLCGPASSPAHAVCPNDATNSGTVSGTAAAADVVGPTAQGVAAGNMAAVVQAIASHVTYVNVHNANHPGGEIRGQIRQHGDDEDDELPGAH